MTTDHVPGEVLGHWQTLPGRPAIRSNAGLINDTFIIERADDSKTILQCLHPIFDASVNLDIAAVTEHLARRGVETPRLVPTDDGALWVEHEGKIWRALTFIAGHTHHKARNPRITFEAGQLVGRFHNALADFRHSYQFSRGDIHDTQSHLERLRNALVEHDNHVLRAEVGPLAETLLDRAMSLPDLGHLPRRHAHGDLKISNILFDQDEHAICLIDLDTLSRMRWPFEMGDALRSWCNPREEDQQPARLELELMEAALKGYSSTAHDMVTPAERDALVDGLAQICLELASRFLADALNEEYFGWDRSRYETRGAHNLARGRAMWALFESVEEQRPQAEQIVKQRLG